MSTVNVYKGQDAHNATAPPLTLRDVGLRRRAAGLWSSRARLTSTDTHGDAASLTAPLALARMLTLAYARSRHDTRH